METGFVNWNFLIGSGGLIGIFILFFWSGRWFGKLDASIHGGFKNINNRIDSVQTKVKELCDKMLRSEENITEEIASLLTKVEQRFDRSDKKLDLIESDIKCIVSRLDRLEVRVEERTMRSVYINKPVEEVGV